MNSTAIPSRTSQYAGIIPVNAGAIRTVLAFLILTVAWVSFVPFQGGADTSASDGGNLVNQLGYTSLLTAAVIALMALVDRRVLVNLVSPGWLLMYALVGLSTFAAPHTESAIRSVLFALIATTMAGTVLVLPANADSLSRALAAACLCVLGLSYFGIFAMPAAAIHQGGEVESIHAGLWRGLFIHKNMAGPVMASIGFCGIYLMRRGWRWIGAAIAVLALIFVWNTGSKTSAALMPAIIIFVMLPSLIGMRFVAAAVVLGAILTIHAMTIGTVFVPWLESVLRAFDETTTYTGRIQIWEFARDFVGRHPWTGYGFDSFWNTAVTENAGQPFDRSWDPRGIVHGHNGFLDIALFMGFPALFLSVWLFVIAPVWDYVRTPLLRENVLLSDLGLMIVAFLAMNSALESYFFRRADPAWLTLVIALAALRLCSRMRVRTR